MRLVGRLDRLYGRGRVDVRFTRIGRRAELETWIRHLALCVSVEEGLDVAPRSVFVGRPKERRSPDRVVVFEAVPDARSHLARLLEWAMAGDARPLPFFPRASLDFARKAVEGRIEEAWRDAHQTLLGGEGGGRTPPEFQEGLELPLVWEGTGPLTPSEGASGDGLRFDTLAEAFFEPFFRAREVHAE